jgi:hypothetical protein
LSFPPIHLVRPAVLLIVGVSAFVAAADSPKQEAVVWPPKAIAPFASPAEPGEGEFTAVPGDVVTTDPNASPAVMQASFRTTGRGTKAVARVVAWDPRRIELRMRPGRMNPVPPKGPRGDGRLPQDAALASRLVGAFNGGFLTEDVTCCDGMTVDGHEYTPATPRGATIALLKDGRTGLGTWPKGPVSLDNLGIVSLRQNLVPFMEDGRVDPYSRKRWGGTLDVKYAVGDKTIRTALCSVKGGGLFYFYLSFADPAQLAAVLTRAGCDYAVHLDMNPGHTSFEFYRALTAAEEPKDPKGVVDFAGQRVEATPLVEKLRKSNFPRYLNKSSSDFFYLVLRPASAVVPDPPVVRLFEGTPAP